MTCRRGLVLALALLLLLDGRLAPVASAQEFASTGGTTVSVEGSVATITVVVDLLLGGLGETEVDPEAQATADGLSREIADYWNQGLDRLATDCLRLELDVEINVLPNAALKVLVLDGDREAAIVTQPGHHVMVWGEDNFGNAHPPETYDPYDDDGVAPPGEDYGSPFEHEMWGYWSPDLETTRDFAHELGHLMGFGDDYADGGPLPGRDGTLMDSGDFVDQNLVDRLAELVRDAGHQLPECWTGTIALTDDDYHEFCTVPVVTAALAVKVADDGTVSGSGTFEHGTWTCTGPPDYVAPPTSGTFEVTGRRTADAFVLSIPDWNPKNEFMTRFPITGEWTVPVSGTAGEADIRTVAWEYHVTIACTACPSGS